MIHVILFALALACGMLSYQVAVFVRFAVAVERERRRRVEQALGAVEVPGGRRSSAGGLSSRPISVYRRFYEGRLLRAGRPTELDFGEFIGLSLAMGIGFVAVSASLDADRVMLMVAGGAGYTLPWLWLGDRARERTRSIVRDLPAFMDLLTLSVSAGLDFTSAIARIIERGKPCALYDELRFLLLEIKLGSSRRTALRNLAERLMVPEVDSLAAAIIQADQYGAPLGNALRVQAEYIRVSRHQAVEKRAGQAVILVSLPTVFFLIPCVFLILVGPYLADLVGAFNSGF